MSQINSLHFGLVVAADEKRGIGKNDKLPWHLRRDLHRFKLITRSHVVIMGRRTWESIPEDHRPLPDRHNIVLTHDKNYNLPESVDRADSLNEALKLAEKYWENWKKNSEKENTGDNPEKKQKNFIIGGGKLFEEAINHPFCRDIWYTRVNGDFGCDTFFPEIPKTFKKIAGSEGFRENNIEFSFEIYRRQE